MTRLKTFLNKLKLIQGIVFDESYNITNILFIPEVINRFNKIRSVSVKRRAAEQQDAEKMHILVVDDSYSTREIERSILELACPAPLAQLRALLDRPA